MPTPTLPLSRPEIFADLPNVTAAFTTRAGGVSEGPFGGLNLGLGVGDVPAAVTENRERVLRALGFDALATGGQVHGADVEAVTRPGHTAERDGLVTDRPGLLLAILTADCGCVLLADPEAGVVGACHAGWRGAVAGVVARTLARMRDLGAEPSRVRAALGPCISAANFEVGPEVAEQFDDAFVVRAPGAKPHVDLKGALRSQLIDAGVADERIEVDARCTFDTAHFYSYRKEGGRTGRMMGLIGLKA